MSKAVFKKCLANRLVYDFLLLFGMVVFIGSLMVEHAQATLSVQAKRISDNGNDSSIDFGSLPGGTRNKLARHYVEVEIDGVSGDWELEIYTDDFETPPDTTTWGYQYGGMKGSSPGNRVPMVWQAWRSTRTVTDPPENLSGWTYVKDKNDLDIPGTTADESWTRAHIDGYTNVAYGGPGYFNVIEPGTTGVGDDDSRFAVYLGGLFGPAATDTYSTIISFDLYHLTPGPLISHKAIDKIGIIGNKIVFNAKVTDDKLVKSATIHYKIGKTGNWETAGMSLKGSATEKTATYVLPPQAVSGPCQIYYWLEAMDDEDNSGRWREESSPQIIEVTQVTIGKVGPRGGKVVVPDGNPDDGEVMVDIPEGALTKDTKITIEQVTDLSGIPGLGGDWEPVVVYNFIEEGTGFKKPVTMNLLYFDLDGDGYPEDWKGEKKEYTESQMACYWWDGFTWRPAGGRIEKGRNFATSSVTHFSYYGLFRARLMGISEYRPKERIITPASRDGKNDVAYFSALSGQLTTIRIYDITGRKIRTIEGEPYEWDGTDDNGNVVESGAYIYQFRAEVEGKKRLVSGTIVVAK